MKASTLSIVVFLMIFQTAFSALDCPVMYHGIKDHSACIAKSAEFVSGGVSEADKKLILDEHNKIRTEVKPKACNMLKLYWNDDLAYVAQKWARNCQFDHDKNFQRSIPGSFSAGQNLGKGFSTWESAIKGWANEVKDFTYGGPNQLEKVGHYTQVVTEKTATIGCGFAECKGFKLYVCNYGPGGNVGSDGINSPWKKCDNGAPLRDCKGKFCKNWGTMKEGTCECDCKDWKHIVGPECSTNCSVKDAYPCGDFYSADKCPKFTNVPPQCPWTCNTCPYIDQIQSACDENASFLRGVLSIPMARDVTVAPVMTVKTTVMTVKTTVMTVKSTVMTVKTTATEESSEHKTSPKPEHGSTEMSAYITGRPTFYPDSSDAAVLKYSVMSVLPLMVLFIANWLFQ